MLIIPAVLTDDPLELDMWLRKIRDTRKFERVQIDFIDGEYADNVTVKPLEADLIPYLPLKFDAHLMVTENNILQWSKLAEKMGFDRIIAQVESISNPEDFSGLALDVHSPVATIESLLPKLEVVVVMAIEPGFGGQEFDPEALEKIKRLSELRRLNKYNFKICVDGGVEKIHLNLLADLGADEVAVGVKRMLNWGDYG